MTLSEIVKAAAGLLIGVPLAIFVVILFRLFWEGWEEWGWRQRIAALIWIAVLVWGGYSLVRFR